MNRTFLLFTLFLTYTSTQVERIILDGKYDQDTHILDISQFTIKTSQPYIYVETATLYLDENGQQKVQPICQLDMSKKLQVDFVKKISDDQYVKDSYKYDIQNQNEDQNGQQFVELTYDKNSQSQISVKQKSNTLNNVDDETQQQYLNLNMEIYSGNAIQIDETAKKYKIECNTQDNDINIITFQVAYPQPVQQQVQKQENNYMVQKIQFTSQMYNKNFDITQFNIEIYNDKTHDQSGFAFLLDPIKKFGVVTTLLIQVHDENGPTNLSDKYDLAQLNLNLDTNNFGSLISNNKLVVTKIQNTNKFIFNIECNTQIPHKSDSLQFEPKTQYDAENKELKIIYELKDANMVVQNPEGRRMLI